jgi:hypothetical protein
MLEGEQVAHLKPRADYAICHAPPTHGLTCGDDSDILSKLSVTSLHQIKHIHEIHSALEALTVGGVFLLDVTSKQVYERFGSNNLDLRDLHPTL